MFLSYLEKKQKNNLLDKKKINERKLNKNCSTLYNFYLRSSGKLLLFPKKSSSRDPIVRIGKRKFGFFKYICLYYECIYNFAKYLFRTRVSSKQNFAKKCEKCAVGRISQTFSHFFAMNFWIIFTQNFSIFCKIYYFLFHENFPFFIRLFLQGSYENKYAYNIYLEEKNFK